MTPLELVALVLLGLIVLVLVCAGGALFWMAGAERRTVELLARTPCPVCRHVLGKSAVDEGRLRSQELASESTSEHLLSTWTLVCPHCRSELMFDIARRAWLSVQHPYRAE